MPKRSERDAELEELTEQLKTMQRKLKRLKRSREKEVRNSPTANILPEQTPEEEKENGKPNKCNEPLLKGLVAMFMIPATWGPHPERDMLREVLKEKR